MPEIVVIGSVNLDLSASVSRLPTAGETVTGAKLSRFPGGKGANQALAAKRLGADVRLIARVGDDAIADEALAMLRAEGVDLSACVADNDLPTGVALICVAACGENHIVVAPGANTALDVESLSSVLSSNLSSKSFSDCSSGPSSSNSSSDYSSSSPSNSPTVGKARDESEYMAGKASADALICQLEIPENVIAHAVSGFDGFFCANLAPAKRIDVAILQRADLIVVNETEAAWYGESLKACHGMVATTYGARGATLYSDGEVIAESEPPQVDVVDTTGAGDTFTAALTLALVEGQKPAEALSFACTAGALAATKAGAQPSLPMRAAVEQVLS